MSEQPSNFRADIEETLAGEPVEAIVIGRVRGRKHEPNHVPTEKAEQVLSWAEAAPWLDYEYDDGYGGEDCHPIWLWTPTRVLFIGSYDGSTWVTAVPRHPQAGAPGSIGSG